MKFYENILKDVNEGLSVNRPLKRHGKDFTTLRRVKDMCELKIVRHDKFNEVRRPVIIALNLIVSPW